MRAQWWVGVLGVVVIAFAAAEAGAAPEQGREGGTCFPNGTCFEGLSCDAGACKSIAAGTLGGACYGNHTCNEGLACSQDRCAQAAPAASSPHDVVVLADGKQLVGTILRQQPGSFVVIRTLDGTQHTLAWNQTTRVTMAPRAEARPGVASPVVINRESANLDTAGGTGTYSQDRGCPVGMPADQCQERLRASVDASGQAQVQQIENCSEGDTRCTQTTQANLGPGTGLKVAYTKEEVTAVTNRPSSSTDFGIGAGVQYGTGRDLTLLGGTIDITIDRVTGKTALPGKEGGSWSGMFFEPKLGLQIMKLSSEGSSGRINGYAAGASLGWQYFNFSPQAGSLKQRGYGIRLGAYGGYQKISGEMDAGGSTIEFSSSDGSYGPSLGYSSLEYNPGTANLKRTDLNLLVLPTGDFTYAVLQFNSSF